MGDIIDDFMGISRELKGLGDDFAGITKEITDGGKQASVDIWDPGKYASKPRITLTSCVHEHSSAATCSRCVDVCPTSALELVDGNLVMTGDLCIGCALCAAACPTYALDAATTEPKRLYDEVAALASSGEMAYVACARALKRTPPAGVKVLPCLAGMSSELWFSLLAEYPNLAVFLPLDACEDCRLACCEDIYGDAIDRGERWSGESVGLECDEDDLHVDKKYSVQRKEFLNSVVKGSVGVAAKANPLTGRAYRAYQKIDEHRKKLSDVGSILDKLLGPAPAEEKRAEPSAARKLMLAALQAHDARAPYVKVDVYETTASCNACGACVKACPMGARVQDGDSVKTLYACCVGCGLCADVCTASGVERVAVSGLALLDEIGIPKKKAAAKEQDGSGGAAAAKKADPVDLIGSALKSATDALVDVGQTAKESATLPKSLQAVLDDPSAKKAKPSEKPSASAQAPSED